MSEHRGLPPLEHAIATDEEIDAQRMLFQSTEADTMQSLAALGLPVQNFDRQPNDSFPDIDLEMLGKEGSAGYESAYNKLLNWHGFLSRNLARARNHVLACSNALKSVSILLKRQALGRYRAKLIKSLDDVENIVTSHPSYLEALLEHQKARERQELLQSYFEQIDAQLRAVSRHIAIRDQDLRFGPERVSNAGRTGAGAPWRDWR